MYLNTMPFIFIMQHGGSSDELSKEDICVSLCQLLVEAGRAGPS